jgi:hypothetical protein
MYLGWLLPVLVLLPNLLMVFFPPVETTAKDTRVEGRMRLWMVLERLGQAGCFGLPLFLPIPAPDTGRAAVLVFMLAALCFYYAGWARYMMGGRQVRLLYAPMASIRLPMAVSPVLYFAAGAVLLGSWPLGLAAALLAAGHIPVSQHEYQKILAGNFAPGGQAQGAGV